MKYKEFEKIVGPKVFKQVVENVTTAHPQVREEWVIINEEKDSEAHEWLLSGFAFVRTPEGQEYWSKIVKKLRGELPVTTATSWRVTWFNPDFKNDDPDSHECIIFENQAITDVIRMIHKHDYLRLEISDEAPK